MIPCGKVVMKCKMVHASVWDGPAASDIYLRDSKCPSHTLSGSILHSNTTFPQVMFSCEIPNARHSSWTDQPASGPGSLYLGFPYLNLSIRCILGDIRLWVGDPSSRRVERPFGIFLSCVNPESITAFTGCEPLDPWGGES